MCIKIYSPNKAIIFNNETKNTTNAHTHTNLPACLLSVDWNSTASETNGQKEILLRLQPGIRLIHNCTHSFQIIFLFRILHYTYVFCIYCIYQTLYVNIFVVVAILFPDPPRSEKEIYGWWRKKPKRCEISEFHNLHSLKEQRIHFCSFQANSDYCTRFHIMLYTRNLPEFITKNINKKKHIIKSILFQYFSVKHVKCKYILRYKFKIRKMITV